MSTITATIATADQVLPISPAAAGYHLTLTDQAGNVVLGSAALSAASGGQLLISVANVPPGTYSASVAAVDATGAPIAPAISAAEPIVVPEPAPTTVTVAIPVSMTVAVS